MKVVITKHFPFGKFVAINMFARLYLKDKDKKIIDLLVYFKYYLTDKDFKDMMGEFQKTLLKLQSEVSTNAFDNVRGKMGIKNLADLETLKNLPKTKIMHHKFETY